MRLPALLLGGILALGLSAQRFYFERLDVQNGLPSSNVYSVLQDSTGLVWLGTEDGLVSFDGRDRVGVRPYGVEDGLAPKGVRCLLMDRTGRFWAGHTGGGISLRTGRTFTLVTPPGARVEKVDLEALADRPYLAHGTVKAHTVDALIAYTARH